MANCIFEVSDMRASWMGDGQPTLILQLFASYHFRARQLHFYIPKLTT